MVRDLDNHPDTQDRDYTNGAQGCRRVLGPNSHHLHSLQYYMLNR